MWLTILPFVLMAVAVVVVPGLAVNFAAGLRPVNALCLAPLSSVGLVSLAAIIAPLVGLRWSLLPVVLLSVLLALVVGGLRRLLARTRAAPLPTDASILPGISRPWRAKTTVAMAGGFVMAATLLSLDGVRMLGSPTAFSQTYDNIYHLNAVRWIVDHGNGSSLAFNMTTGDGPASFYPSAWHDLVSAALIGMGSTDVTRGNNAAIIVVLALVWPLSCLTLARILFPPSATIYLASGLLAASIGAFPYLLLGFGVLFPNFLGLALLPAVMALGVNLVRLGHGESLDRYSTVAIGLLGMAGVALAHPNVALTMVAIVAPLLAIAWSTGGLLAARRGTLGRGAAVARLLSAGALLVLAWVLFSTLHAPYDSLWWPVSRSRTDAIGEALLLAPRDTPVPVLAALLTLAGIYAVVRTGRHRWLLGCHGAFVFLWVVVSSSTDPGLRDFLGAPWYNDSYRLASLLPISAIPLAVFGLEFVLDYLRGAGDGGRVATRPAWWSYALVAATTLALLVGTQVGGKQSVISWVHGHYVVTPDAPLVDTDEYAMLMRVPEIVPADEVIAVNPWNGSSMAYALTGRRTTFTHVQYPPDPAKDVLVARLAKAASDPAVCGALRELGVKWVLDFGNTRLINNEQRAFPGFEGLAKAPGFERRAAHGHAALYEITACGL